MDSEAHSNNNNNDKHDTRTSLVGLWSCKSDELCLTTDI